MKQIKPFKPGFTLGERAEKLEKKNLFIVTTSKGTKHEAPVVVIAGGLGCFEPRKPLIENISEFEGKELSILLKILIYIRIKKLLSQVVVILLWIGLFIFLKLQKKLR